MKRLLPLLKIAFISLIVLLSFSCTPKGNHQVQFANGTSFTSGAFFFDMNISGKVENVLAKYHDNLTVSFVESYSNNSSKNQSYSNASEAYESEFFTLAEEFAYVFWAHEQSNFYEDDYEHTIIARIPAGDYLLVATTDVKWTARSQYVNHEKISRIFSCQYIKVYKNRTTTSTFVFENTIFK